MTHMNETSEPALTPVLRADVENRPRVATATHGMAWMLGAEQPVLEAQALIEQLGLGDAIGVLRIKLAFPAEVFALALRPLIHGYAEFVQMLPVRGMRTGRFAHPGGQLERGLTTALRSLDRRRGQILPRGGAPEVIGAQAHRWTYAVFVAALLRDVRVSHGLRVWLKKDADQPCAWDPAVGPMRACGANAYVFESLPTEMCLSSDDPRLAFQLFERCVPALIQDWLKEDPLLMSELRACLSGDANPAGAIRGLVECPLPIRASAPAPTLRPAPLVETSVAAANAPLASDAVTVARPEFLEHVKPDESAFARKFMAWMSQGVLDGTLAVNTPVAFVHVVAEGLLLVSPRIFREFVKEVALSEPVADAAKRAQREVLREGWHLRAERGVNILCYERQRADHGVTRINGIVIREPERFIQSLPAIDSTLVCVADGAVIGVPT
jgi:hypothetical protein